MTWPSRRESNGFSRIRPTELRENVEWIKRSLKSRLRPFIPKPFRKNKNKYAAKNKTGLPTGQKTEMPTHIACYDLKKKECVFEMNLEPHGISAIFSIFPVGA